MSLLGAHIGWADQCQSALQLTQFDQIHTVMSTIAISWSLSESCSDDRKHRTGLCVVVCSRCTYRHAPKSMPPQHLKAITFGTYGAFGKGTHKLIAAATTNTPCPVFSPWVRPSPKQHAYLLFGFTLARANARMLLNAASKRSSAKNAVRTSRSRSLVAGNE